MVTKVGFGKGEELVKEGRALSLAGGEMVYGNFNVR